MKCICPECKNDVDLAPYPRLAVGDVVECGTCGMTLEVRSMDDGEVATEIVDEGK